MYGMKINFFGWFYDIVVYGVDFEILMIDMDEVCCFVIEYKFKVIIVGWFVYFCMMDFVVFCVIVDEVGVLFWVDMVYFVGLVVVGLYLNLVLYVYVVFLMVYKIIGGLCFGFIFINDVEFVKKINIVVFFG